MFRIDRSWHSAAVRIVLFQPHEAKNPSISPCLSCKSRINVPFRARRDSPLEWALYMEELSREAKQKTGLRQKASIVGAGFPPDIALLLSEIEREPVPERLLLLAEKLQAALIEQRKKAAAE